MKTNKPDREEFLSGLFFDTRNSMPSRQAKTKMRKQPLYLSSGSTMLNLACTDTAEGAFARGTYQFIVGDSASGKTWLMLNALAEAANHPAFESYRLIYDDAENGALMDVEKFFGRKLKSRLEVVESEYIEDFYDFAEGVLAQGPCIYVLDSMDVLTSEDEEKKLKEQKTARDKGTAVKGSYGDGKAKKNSTRLRRLIKLCRDTKSILFIISQTRDNIGFDAMFNPKVRSGGRALRFYAHLEIWTSIRKTLTTKTKATKRPIEQGILCEAKVKKNRYTGKRATCTYPIYHSYGIDDVGSIIDFLIEYRWNATASDKAKTSFDAPELGIKGTRTKLIESIESQEKESQLRALAQETWQDIENANKVKRKARYE